MLVHSPKGEQLFIFVNATGANASLETTRGTLSQINKPKQQIKKRIGNYHITITLLHVLLALDSGYSCLYHSCCTGGKHGFSSSSSTRRREPLFMCTRQFRILHKGDNIVRRQFRVAHGWRHVKLLLLRKVHEYHRHIWTTRTVTAA